MRLGVSTSRSADAEDTEVNGEDVELAQRRKKRKEELARQREGLDEDEDGAGFDGTEIEGRRADNNDEDGGGGGSGVE